MDNVERPVRTGVQVGLGTILVEFVDAFFYEFSDKQYAAAVALLTILLSVIMGFIDKSYPLLGREDD